MSVVERRKSAILVSPPPEVLSFAVDHIRQLGLHSDDCIRPPYYWIEPVSIEGLDQVYFAYNPEETGGSTAAVPVFSD